MNLYTIIAKIVLFPTKEIFLLPFIALLFHLYDRYIVCRAAYLLFFTLVFNKFLKELFAIPLDPMLHQEGFAFPSGHMQASVVFFLYLALESEKNLYKILSILYCSAVGASLIYLKYHNLPDILAAAAFGIVSVWIMRKISYMNFLTKKEYYLPIYVQMLTLTIMYFLSKNYPYLWVSVGSLTGFIIGLYVRDKKQIDNVQLGFEIPRPLSALSVIIGIISIYGTVSLIGLIPFINRSFLHFLRFTWIVYWVSCGAEIYMQQLIEKLREQHRLKQEKEGAI
jgi:hypothetical protein